MRCMVGRKVVGASYGSNINYGESNIMQSVRNK